MVKKFRADFIVLFMDQISKKLRKDLGFENFQDAKFLIETMSSLYVKWQLTFQSDLSEFLEFIDEMKKDYSHQEKMRNEKSILLVDLKKSQMNIQTLNKRKKSL